MLKILVVEDEPTLAERLKYLIELNPRYEVTGVADDVAGALASVEERRPDLALVDLQLARGSTGFAAAAKLAELSIPCLFTTGKAPSFPMPDLALGCLIKPYSEEDLVRALRKVEDMIRGREALRPRLPQQLRLYSAAEPGPAPAEETAPAAAWVPAPRSRRSFRAKLARWWPAAKRSSRAMVTAAQS